MTTLGSREKILPMRTTPGKRAGASSVLAWAVWATIFLGLAAGAAEAGRLSRQSPIIVGGDHYYPPYEFLDEQGEPSGYNVELTRAIAEVMGMQVEIVLGPWDDMRRALEQGQVDALQGMVYSEERSSYLDFSPPHTIVHQSVFARRNTPAVKSLEALRGKGVIVQKDGIMHDYLVDNEVGAVLVLTDTHAAALRLLASGKHDYAMVANLPGLYLGRELGLSNIVPVAEPLAAKRYGYAVRKGNTELLAQFSEGLAILKNTGRYQQIYDKWLGVLEPRGISWRRVLRYGAAVIVPLLLVLGATVVWSRTLQKKVAQRTRELQLRQQQLIQADKMTSLGILVSGVAHEINNPTGLILLNVPVLEKAYKLAEASLEDRYRDEGDFMLGGLRYSVLREEVPHMFSEMLEGARRIKRIVEDLKDFARQDNADLNDTVDLNAVVQTALRLVDNSIRKATDRFAAEYAEPLPVVRGNVQRIEQVVVNLVLNACQALQHKEQGISLVTRHDDSRGMVALAVRDQGRGISPEHLSHLTDPFFTTRRDSGGTGLGLSVSAGIIEDHQGTLEFSSVPGQGTTATLWLPVAKEGDMP